MEPRWGLGMEQQREPKMELLMESTMELQKEPEKELWKESRS